MEYQICPLCPQYFKTGLPKAYYFKFIPLLQKLPLFRYVRFVQDRRDFVKLGTAGLLGLFTACSSEPSDQTQNNEVNYGANRKDWSWENIRKEFSINPSLEFMNNGTLGLSPKTVQNALIKQVEFVNSTGGYSGFEKDLKTHLTTFLGVAEDEIALTHNVTEGVNVAAWALDLKAGDEIILTNHEHVGNAVPWLNRKRIDGIDIKMLELPNTQEACLDEIKKLVTPRTRVIAVPHITCTTGQVLPIKEICSFARSKGIKTLIDGAHGIGMLSLNIRDLGCDIYSSCAHKWLLGPKGTGLLFVRREILEECEVRFAGSHTDDGWVISKEKSEILGLKNSAHRYYYGTQSSALQVGTDAAVQFMMSIGMERVEARIRELNQLLFSELSKVKNVHILTPAENVSRCGMVSFTHRTDALEEYKQLRAKKWVVRYVAESNLNCLRVSTHIYNSEEQIYRLVEAVKKS